MQVVLSVARMVGFFVERSPIWLGDSEEVSIARAAGRAVASDESPALAFVRTGAVALGRASVDPMTW